MAFESLAAGLAATLERWRAEFRNNAPALDLSAVLATDRWARAFAEKLAL
jgi:hypothetical protein